MKFTQDFLIGKSRGYPTGIFIAILLRLPIDNNLKNVYNN